MANAAQKKWMNDISEWYREVGFDHPGLCNSWYNFHLHHVGGRKLKQNKVPIGHWFILPIPIRLHDINSDHHLNITHHKNDFTEHFGLQSELFMIMIESMIEYGAELPFGTDVINAIEDTRR
jgi:hypothetical protein